MGCGSPVFDIGMSAESRELEITFLYLCDLACKELNKTFTPFIPPGLDSADDRTHHMPFFEDAHAICALSVAYERSGNKTYLDTCERWVGQISDAQERMIPIASYYMNYGRSPGEIVGDWYVADSATIGMGVLATAIRMPPGHEKLRYLNSVRSFAQLVADNYAGKDGGVNDGLWSAYKKEWWTSTATAGTLFFLLHECTRPCTHLPRALAAFDWLIRNGLHNAVSPSFEEDAPAVIFYCGLFYATALKHFAPGTPRWKAINDQIEVVIRWLAENQKSQNPNSRLNYWDNTYMAGMPHLMCMFQRQLPHGKDLQAAVDDELRYVTEVLLGNWSEEAMKLRTWELLTWSMFSYAERLSPGAMFRSVSWQST
jgi:hypothetical protein